MSSSAFSVYRFDGLPEPDYLSELSHFKADDEMSVGNTVIRVGIFGGFPALTLVAGSERAIVIADQGANNFVAYDTNGKLFDLEGEEGT